MKTEKLTALGLTEEQAAKVFAMNGKDVTAEKAKFADYEDIKNQLKTAKTATFLPPVGGCATWDSASAVSARVAISAFPCGSRLPRSHKFCSFQFGRSSNSSAETEKILQICTKVVMSIENIQYKRHKSFRLWVLWL